MNGTRTVEDLAEVVAGVRGMLQPEDIWGEVGRVGVGGVTGGRHRLGWLAGEVEGVRRRGHSGLRMMVL